MSAESDLAPVLHIERELRHLSVLITQPKPGECLNCYVYRMLEFGCTGMRWAKRYRDLRASRATALDTRLMSRGAGCDCEIFLNGWNLRREYQVYDPESEEYEYPEELPRVCRRSSWLRPALRSLGYAAPPSSLVGPLADKLASEIFQYSQCLTLDVDLT